MTQHKKRLDLEQVPCVSLAQVKQHLLCDSLFHSVFEGLSDPILLLKEGRFIECNAATLIMLGYDSKNDFLHSHPSEISPLQQPDGRFSEEKANEMINMALQHGFHRFEWQHLRVDGSAIFVEVALTPLRVDDQIIVSALWRDLTRGNGLKQSSLNRVMC